MKIVGVKKVDFKAKDGEQVSGYKVHCTFEDKGTDGVACESIFVSEKKANGWVPRVGQNFELSYNKYGKIDSVRAA